MSSVRRTTRLQNHEYVCDHRIPVSAKKTFAKFFEKKSKLFQKIYLDAVSFAVWPRQPRNETMRRSRSTGCQSLSSVRCLVADKKPKNENHENCENIDQHRFKSRKCGVFEELRENGRHQRIPREKLPHLGIFSSLYDRKLLKIASQRRPIRR